jgi:hypothetical protein
MFLIMGIRISYVRVTKNKALYDAVPINLCPHLTALSGTSAARTWAQKYYNFLKEPNKNANITDFFIVSWYFGIFFITLPPK